MTALLPLAAAVPLDHGGDTHSTLWWIVYLSVVVVLLVVAMGACLLGAVRSYDRPAPRTDSPD